MIPAHLRRKRVWTVDDFAEFIGSSHKVALRRLHRYNAELGGKLLVPGDRGRNRRWTFQPAYLAQAIDDGRLAIGNGLFGSLDTLEMRLDTLEEQLGDLYVAHRTVATVCGDHGRELARLKTRLKRTE